eukprot:scaffold6073_cov169-Amphora_coffeaeformis.AAC.5
MMDIYSANGSPRIVALGQMSTTSVETTKLSLVLLFAIRGVGTRMLVCRSTKFGRSTEIEERRSSG